jgi:thioredoxin reductase (NADPH)
VFPGRAAKGLMPGGQLMLTTDVENYPGYPEGVAGPVMMEEFYKQAMRFGTRVVTDDGPKDAEALGQTTLFHPYQDVTSIDLSSRPFRIEGDAGFVCHAESVIVATGAKANWLNVPGEQRLATSGGGVSACAVCDGALPMFRDAELGVVGGGDSAVEEASHLVKFASKIHMFVRRDELRASQIMQDRVLNDPKVQIHWHTEVREVLGEEKITGVKVEHNQTGEVSELPLGGLFMAIGHTPITGFLGGQVELEDTKYIKLTQPGQTFTSVEGVFAAGDVADSTYRQAITAAGMGCKAAMDAERWLVEAGELDRSVATAGWTG